METEISTHALTEGDVVISVSCLLTWNFNSRPHGGRLHTPEDRGAEAVISTHALTEGDTAPARSPGASEHFNSRPHGGRPVHCPFSSGVLISTHALTEGDVTGKGQRYFVNISTHALTEGDSMRIHCVIAKSDISTHALTEGDHNLPVSHHCSLYFNSRPHGGRRYKAPR